MVQLFMWQDIPKNVHIHSDCFNKVLKKYHNPLTLMFFLVTVLNYIHATIYFIILIKSIFFFSCFKQVILLHLNGCIKSYMIS